MGWDQSKPVRPSRATPFAAVKAHSFPHQKHSVSCLWEKCHSFSCVFELTSSLNMKMSTQHTLHSRERRQSRAMGAGGDLAGWKECLKVTFPVRRDPPRLRDGWSSRGNRCWPGRGQRDAGRLSTLKLLLRQSACVKLGLEAGGS